MTLEYREEKRITKTHRVQYHGRSDGTSRIVAVAPGGGGDLLGLHGLRSFCQTFHLKKNKIATFSFLGFLFKSLTLRRSAVLRNCGSWSWATLTSPAYMNSRMAVRCWKGTSFRIMMGCLAEFSSSRAISSSRAYQK